MQRQEAKYAEITLGTTLCEIIKFIYFADKAWPECYKEVASKFTELKYKARKFYTDMSIIDILKELNKYNKDDIVELINS